MPDTGPFLRDPRILRSLQYFEAVARHGSVKLAAEEIGVSASAVSHQLRELTRYLGEDIVERQGRGIILTASGKRLYEQLSAVFSSIGAMVAEVVGRKRRYVRLAVCSSFGPYWLSDRLVDFHLSHPDIDLELRLFAQDPMQTDTVADVIVTADPVTLGFDSATLFDEMLVAVRRPPDGAGPAAGKPRLITTDLEPGLFAQDWNDFFAHSGRSRDDFQTDGIIKCSHYLLALGMAKAGVGVALVPDFLADGDVKAGLLQYVDRTLVPSGRTYRLCYKTSRSSEADLRSLVRWLRSQTSGSVIPFRKPLRS